MCGWVRTKHQACSILDPTYQPASPDTPETPARTSSTPSSRLCGHPYGCRRSSSTCPTVASFPEVLWSALRGSWRRWKVWIRCRSVVIGGVEGGREGREEGRGREGREQGGMREGYERVH